VGAAVDTPSVPCSMVPPCDVLGDYNNNMRSYLGKLSSRLHNVFISDQVRMDEDALKVAVENTNPMFLS
jgi:hypothetical protein